MEPKQLGLHAYFNPRWFEISNKINHLGRFPKHLGHISLVPKPNTYAISPVDGGEHLITRDGDGKIHVFQNSCRHQGARLVMSECGDVSQGECRGMLTCPLHQWTWGLDGTLRGAPQFEIKELASERKQLNEIPHVVWGDMIFVLPKANLSAKLPWEEGTPPASLAPFKLDNFIASGNEPIVHESDVSSIIFADVYCDMRHVRLGHQSTLGSVFDTKKLQWQFGKFHSIQRVPLRQFADNPGPEYAHWHELTRRILDALDPEESCNIFRGVLWGFFYPGLTIEVFPLCTAVSTIVPTGPSSHRNIVQFFFPKVLAKVGALLDEYKEVQIKAYTASMREDDNFIHRLNSGLRDMYDRRERFEGHAHPTDEAGILKFHEFLAPIEREFSKTRY